MKLGIDASNIRGGGGVTHLSELLRAAKPYLYGFDKVVIWSGASTLARVDDRAWLRKVHISLLDRSLLSRTYWQRIVRDRTARQEGCDVLFTPGASYSGSFHPIVTMSQNLLPFEWSEARRYGLSRTTLKFLLLHISQMLAFKRADGLIFLTEYAREAVLRFMDRPIPKNTIISHGIDDRFRQIPKMQKPVSAYSQHSPFQLLYVSPIAPYKHQWHVVEAVSQLRQSGFPVNLKLVGPPAGSEKRLRKSLTDFDPDHNWSQYTGAIPFKELHNVYQQADIFIFASSCENMPITLMEAMSSGLPIACSDRGAMPEVLGTAGVYFDPENPREIASAIRLLLENPDLRVQNAQLAYNKARSFTWERCANETFSFIAEVAKDYFGEVKPSHQIKGTTYVHK